jgi:guanylate kinase
VVQSKGKSFVISSPSGGGKSSLIAELLRRLPDRLRYSISATTRKPHHGEVDGTHYFFKSLEGFQDMIEAGELAEFNEVHGNFYGTPRKPLDAALSQGFGVVLDLDVYGKANFDKIYPDTVGILIVPPSSLELERRLRSRATDHEETIQLRLRNARDELEFAGKKGKYEYTVVNDDFHRALEELIGIVKREMRQTGA